MSKASASFMVDSNTFIIIDICFKV